MKKPIFTALALAITLSWGTVATSQQPQADSMSEAEMAMMQAWQQAATPGSQHAALAATTGTWDATTSFWMNPDEEPEVSKSTVKRSMSLDGRVLEERWNGNVMGQAFIGHGRTGYDNVTGQYWSSWTDNMSTGIMLMHGEHDVEAGKFTFTGETVDPVTKATIQNKMVQTTSADGGKELMTMYETHDGEEVKVMAIEMTRQ